MSIQFGLRRCNIVLLAILLLTFLSSCENRDSPVDNNSGYSREIEPKIYLEAEGSGFQDIWASSEDNIYTVSHTGKILHYDGYGWTFEAARLSGTSFKICGTDSGIVGFLSNYGEVICVDRQGKWYLAGLGVGRLIGGYFDDSTRICVVDCNGEIQRCDGDGQWSVIVEGSETHSVRDVCRNKHGVLFAVGDGGLILRRADGDWERMVSGTAVDLKAVFPGEEILAVGNGGVLLKYEDSNWQKVDIGTSSDLTDVWSSSSGEVFVAGQNGTMLCFRSHRWERLGLESMGWLSSVWGFDEKNVFVTLGDSAVVLRYDGLGWNSEVHMTPRDFRSVWGSSPDDIFAVGDGQALHYNGRGWKEMKLPVQCTLNDVWGLSSSAVFAASAGYILKYDGRNWHTMLGYDYARVYNSIHGTAANDIYAVGQDGVIIHYDGYNWTLMNSGTTEDLSGVWAYSKDWVFAVGPHGTILRYHDSTWTKMVFYYSSATLTAVWAATNTSAVFVVCQEGEVFVHGVTNDDVWVTTSSQGSLGLYDICGTSGQYIVAVGQRGNIWLRDGTSTTLIRETNQNLRSVWIFSEDNWVAVGDNGTVVRCTSR